MMPLAWLGCGEAHLRLRHLPEAELALRRALMLDPGSADAETALGELFLQKGDMENALSAFSSALRHVPGHQRALDGRLHARMRNVRLMDRLAGLIGLHGHDDMRCGCTARRR